MIKPLILFFAILLINVHFINAQKYTPLVPSMRPAAPGATTNVPNYGGLLITIQNEVLLWANNKCQESINKQVSDNLEKERSMVKKMTTYLVVVNITDKMKCTVETFRALKTNEDPAIIHDDKAKYLVYTLDIYPWIIYKNKRY